jgi:hypothetical protein
MRATGRPRQCAASSWPCQLSSPSTRTARCCTTGRTWQCAASAGAAARKYAHVVDTQRMPIDGDVEPVRHEDVCMVATQLYCVYKGLMGSMYGCKWAILEAMLLTRARQMPQWPGVVARALTSGPTPASPTGQPELPARGPCLARTSMPWWMSVDAQCVCSGGLVAQWQSS